MPQTLPDTVANTTLITRADIDRSAAVDLPSLLSKQLGVEIGSSGGAGQQSSIFMRGTESSQVLVLLDGVPLNSQIGGAATLELVALDAIDRIEIVRGNVSAQYGNRAVGGVIQLFSKAMGTSPTQSIGIELGTLGHKKLHANLNFKQDQTRYGLNVARTEYKGQSAINTNQLIANPDKDGYGQTLLNAYVNQTINTSLKLGVSLSSTSMKVAYDDDYALAPTTDKQVLDKSSEKIQVSTEWKISEKLKNTVKLSQLKEKAIAFSNFTYDSTSKDKQTQISMQNDYATETFGDVYLGIDLSKNAIVFDFPAYGSPAVIEQRNTRAWLAGWQGKVDAFSWNLNLRNEHADKESNNTYFAGLGYELFNGFSIKGSQSTAFIRPTIAERFGYGSGYNPNLRAGEALSKELALQWVQGKTIARLSSFKQEAVNQIVFDPSAKLLKNIKEGSNKGLELTVEMDAPWSNGKIKFNVTKQNPINSVTNKTLSRRAKEHAGLGLSGGFGELSWDTSIKFQGNRGDTDFSTFTPVVLKSYARVDAGLTYQLSSKISASLALRNLTKANDQTAYGYNGTPRGAMLRLNYKL
jgi:vitamin B12 transporter